VASYPAVPYRPGASPVPSTVLPDRCSAMTTFVPYRLTYSTGDHLVAVLLQVELLVRLSARSSPCLFASASGGGGGRRMSAAAAPPVPAAGPSASPVLGSSPPATDLPRRRGSPSPARAALPRLARLHVCCSAVIGHVKLREAPWSHNASVGARIPVVDRSTSGLASTMSSSPTRRQRPAEVRSSPRRAR